MRLFALAGLLVFGAGISGCTLGFHDDVHMRGSDSIGDTTQYRAVDNAIYDVLVKMYGKNRVMASDWPEVEYHKWVVISKEFSPDGQRHRLRIQARPQAGEDGVFVPQVMVEDQIYMQNNLSGNMGKVNERGSSGWIQGARVTKDEMEIANAVNAAVESWRNSGGADTGSRHEDYLDRRSS